MGREVDRQRLETVSTISFYHIYLSFIFTLRYIAETVRLDKDNFKMPTTITSAYMEAPDDNFSTPAEPVVEASASTFSTLMSQLWSMF